MCIYAYMICVRLCRQTVCIYVFLLLSAAGSALTQTSLYANMKYMHVRACVAERKLQLQYMSLTLNGTAWVQNQTKKGHQQQQKHRASSHGVLCTKRAHVSRLDRKEGKQALTIKCILTSLERSIFGRALSVLRTMFQDL